MIQPDNDLSARIYELHQRSATLCAAYDKAVDEATAKREEAFNIGRELDAISEEIGKLVAPPRPMRDMFALGL